MYESVLKPIEDQYLQTCKKFFYAWAYLSGDNVFVEPPQDYLDFCNTANRLNKEPTASKKFFAQIVYNFQKESKNINPLDRIFSLSTNWNINSYLVVKNFIPYVLRLCPDVKFKRIGSILQTNNHLYLFSGMFKHLLVKTYNQNRIRDNEALDELLCIYLSIRFRQIHGEKSFENFEDKFLESHMAAMEHNGSPVIYSFKEAFADFRQKIIFQKITNQQLDTAIKNLQNLLGKNAMTSTKKNTFFWQMIADLNCDFDHSYVSPYETKFFLHIQNSNNDKSKFIFNKEAFKAFEKIGFEKIQTHCLLYVYILHGIYEKIQLDFIRVNEANPLVNKFIDAIYEADSIFTAIKPNISTIESILLKNKKEIVDNNFLKIFKNNLDSIFNLSSIPAFSIYLGFTLKETLGVLDDSDLKELYQPFM